MPSKFVVRDLRKNCSYHVTNQSTEPILFKDEQDYRVFLFYVFIATEPMEQVLVKYPDLPLRLRVKNLHDEVRIEGYCLLPSHFHFLVRQITQDGLPKLMKRVINGYTSYYNHKYKRAGSVFRGRYKAALVKDGELGSLLKYLYSHGQDKWTSENDQTVVRDDLNQEQIKRLGICVDS